jgi:hypothetical protein
LGFTSLEHCVLLDKINIRERNWLTRTYDAGTNHDRCQESCLPYCPDTVHTSDLTQVAKPALYVTVIDVIRYIKATSHILNRIFSQQRS